MVLLCFETWLDNLETPIKLDMRGVSMAQQESFERAVEEQNQIR
jgi:hypothetical protein